MESTPAWHLCDVCGGSGLGVWDPWRTHRVRKPCPFCLGLGYLFGVWVRDNAGHRLFVEVKQRRWLADGLNAGR